MSGAGPIAHASRQAGDFTVARRPIYDRELEVVAYSIVVGEQAGADAAADAASALDLLSEIGLARMTVGRPAHVRVSPTFAGSDQLLALPPEHAVLELNPAGCDRGLADLLGLRRRQGYRVALRGPVPPELSGTADTVVLDGEALDPATLRAEAAHSRREGATLMASGLDSDDRLRLCQELGFERFEGDVFSRPSLVHGRRTPIESRSRVDLLAHLHAPGTDFEDLQQIITRDVSLTHKLLTYVNSAFFGLPREIASVRDALVTLGAENVRRWATLIAVAEAGTKPHELVVTGLVRAKMCELLASGRLPAEREEFFLTGLFSVLDALLDTPLVQLLAQLPLSNDTVRALLVFEGPKGEALLRTLAYEQGDLRRLGEASPAVLRQAYLDATAWADAAAEGLH
jgi:c-di-GMP phosphodiesterase